MPRPKVDLSPEDRAVVRQARDQAEKARAAYRAVLRKMAKRYTQAAVARALGISPQALSEYLKRR